jgi:protein CpxP
MMKNIWKTWLAISALLISTAAVAGGSGGHHAWQGDFGDPDRLVEHMTRRLELDETQTAKVQNIVTAAKPEMLELRDRAMQNHEAVRTLDANDPDFDTKLANLAQENGELATAATLLHGRLRAEINAVLTPEQREEFAGMSHRSGRRGPPDRQ